MYEQWPLPPLRRIWSLQRRSAAAFCQRQNAWRAKLVKKVFGDFFDKLAGALMSPGLLRLKNAAARTNGLGFIQAPGARPAPGA